jgi:hypothetical protein
MQDAPFALPVPLQPTAPPATRAPSRAAAIGLLASCGAITLGALTKAWFTARDAGVGLLGAERCHGSACQSMSWFDIKQVPQQVAIFATIALVAALVFVALSIHAAAMMMRGEPAKIQFKFLNGTLGLASGGMTAFVFSLSVGDWSRGLSLGWSTFVGLGGIVAAAIIYAAALRPLAKAKV